MRLRSAGRRFFVHVELTLPNELTMAEVHSLQSKIKNTVCAIRPETLLVTFGH